MRCLAAMTTALIWTGCGSNDWKAAHRTAIGAAAGSLACDWHGTRSMATAGWVGDDGRGKYESNPAIQAMGGRKPDPQIIDAYFLAIAGLSTLAWYAVPRRYRIAVPAILTTISVKATINNIVHDVGPCGF